MDYTTIAFAFGMLTLFLIVAEFFIPSGGLISLVALGCGAVSVWGAHKAWAESNPAIWWTYLVVFFTLIPGAMFLVLGILPKTKYGKRLFLEPKEAGKSAAYHETRETMESLIGKQGVAATLHSPGGMVEIEGRRYHSESEGVWLEPGTKVEVRRVVANRLILREVDASLGTETSDSPSTPDSREKPVASEDLDFRIPEE